MSAVIHWFRQDLRLSDHPALRASCQAAERQGLPWLPVFVWDASWDAPGHWVPRRMGTWRRQALTDALRSLDDSLQAHGHRLLVLHGEPAAALAELMAHTGARELWSEHLPAPEEEAADARLTQAARAAGWRWHRVYQSGLFELADLPFDVARTPDVFTAFRQSLNRQGAQPCPPVEAPDAWPRAFGSGAPWLDGTAAVTDWPAQLRHRQPMPDQPRPADTRSSFPMHEPAWRLGESQAQRHWRSYLQRGLPHRYKATRNGLHGTDFSTKLSPWLAWGSISARQAQHALAAWEAEHGASESSGWITFELLWREHFRLMHFKHGRRLYGASGLSELTRPPHDAKAFLRWCEGRTGQALVDAGMRELATTGWLSNRLRQIVASYLIHDLACDWRAGAAWFESQLIDFDVFSNQGNWLYIAGRGTDPRGGRRFDPEKQTREHDPHAQHRQRWQTA